MKVHRFHVVQVVAAAFLLVALVFLVGCGSFGGAQNTFAPEGDVAEKQRDLFLLVLWPAIAVLILVAGVLTYALVRFRRRRADEPPPRQVHGNPRLEIAWTVLPALLLLGLAVPTVAAIVDLGGEAEAGALRVRVMGQQFSWFFEYPELTDAEGKPLSTSGELYIPVGREIDLAIEARDVIHSFWVPKLAGKQDAIPGRTNRLVFTAKTPGAFSGQCAEFCGLLHAQMRFTVIVLEKEEFEAWVQEQLAGVEEAATSGD